MGHKQTIKSQACSGRMDASELCFSGEVAGLLWRSGAGRAKKNQLELLNTQVSWHTGQEVTPQRLQGERKCCCYTKGTRYKTEDELLACSSADVLGRKQHFCWFGKPEKQTYASMQAVEVWKSASSAPVPSWSVSIKGSLCCIKLAQLVLAGSARQGECLAAGPHEAVRQEEQLPDKRNLFPTRPTSMLA